MELHEVTLEADKIHLNRLSVASEDEGEQDAALTIVAVLDKVANIVDNVQASQKRIEERHRQMEDAIKSIQIDILKLAQAHANTGYTVDKLLDKTRKVSSNVKDVKARVDKQSGHVQKVESKQEELLRKNKFRVVIFQEDTPCPTKLTVVKETTMDGQVSEEFCPPEDLSSDEEYTVAETRATRLKKSSKQRIDNIKKAFSKEKMQKTRQNIGKKVSNMRTRIVTPERRERIRQSGERLKQSGERFKQSIAKAAPKKENFKMKVSKKDKERTLAEGQEGSKEGGVDAALDSGNAQIISEEVTYTQVVTVKKKEASTNTGPYYPFEEKPSPAAEKITLKQEDELRVDDEAPLLDIKQS